MVSESQLPEEATLGSRVRELLQKLAQADRSVVALRCWKGLSYAGMAEVTGTMESAVKSRLQRARVALARHILEHSWEHEETRLGFATQGEGRELSIAVP